MKNRKSQRWQGMVFLVLGLAVLGWEWSRSHDAVAWWPSWVEIILIILSPVFCLVGFGMLLTRRTPEPLLVTPFGIFGLLLGIMNAYLLGVWRSVYSEGLWELTPLLLIVGLLGGVLFVREKRARAREDAARE